MRLLLLAALASLVLGATAQEAGNSFVHKSYDDGYEWPTDAKVLEKLDKWQDQKLGVLFHWGLYSVPGIVESWQICSEDWITRPPEYTYEGYKQWYWGLCNALNPTDFDPQQWADIMKDAGIRYMIFTTKHHDGFCMYDSKYTPFSIAQAGPFATDERRDVARHVFDTFRKDGFMVGAYFSKPDWHCKWFWNPYYATPNRMQNYKREQHPDWWENYQQFTSNQMNELMADYGPFDIFWLDGGWIEGDEVGLDSVLAVARDKYSPGMLAVDRVIKGKNENYQTPERSVPDRQIDHPWESCIPLSDDWGWTPRPRFKSANKMISTLAEITAKGGCLLLGVGPTAQGLIQPEVEAILKEIGAWMRINGEAIYDTRITERYNDGNMWFSASKDGKTIYGVYALADDAELPSALEWEGNVPFDGYVTLLDGNRRVKAEVKNGRVKVKLPKGMRRAPVAVKIAVGN